MELADVLEHEQVHVLDLDNGARFETYAISGGPGDVVLNGAAARLVHTGDRVIVISYAQYDEEELESYAPKVVHVDSRNRPTDPEFQALDRELHELAPCDTWPVSSLGRCSTCWCSAVGSPACREPCTHHAPAGRSSSSRRASSRTLRPGTPRVASPPRSTAAPGTHPSCTAPTPSRPAPASATLTRCGYSSPRARTACGSSSTWAPCSTRRATARPPAWRWRAKAGTRRPGCCTPGATRPAPRSSGRSSPPSRRRPPRFARASSRSTSWWRTGGRSA